MTRVVTAATWLVVSGLSIGGEVLACGDKFLVPTRGSRYEQPPQPRRPAAILFYANPSSELSLRWAKFSVADALTKVGYQPTMVSSTEELSAAIRRRHWDLVVIDVADVRTIDGAGPGLPSSSIVPVTYTVNGEAWKEMKRRYPSIVKAPSKARSFVEAVDAALEGQRSTRAAQTRK